MTYDEDKDNDKYAKETEKVQATTHKKQSYSLRHYKNIQISRATDFVGDTREIDGLLCPLS